ncbi:MAG: hypothetical protein NT062_21890 [Proteobacteria bacterium]|nr:hypothetical protein [Pseudomonadota bacterium]
MATRPAAPVVLGNRFTALAGFGMLVLEVHDETGSGMALQPTLTRTYDRVELQAELTLATWADRTGTPHKGRFERIGAAARYQAGRIRIEQTMTLDLVLDAGVGLQRIERDEDTLIERADLEVGFGLRMLTDMAKPSSSRMLFGMEMMMRLLIMPRADASADLALVLVFGIPVGK